MIVTRAFLLAGIMAAAGSQAADLDFDKTFSSKGEARQLHYSATYLAEGRTHAVQVWRDGEQRLKRRTDDKLETHIFKPAGQTEWQMVVLDLPRQIRTDIERTNLYRIGHFTDWFSMAHALTRPTGPYRLTALKQAPVADAPLGPCRWYALDRAGTVSNVCWSGQLRLPLLIADGGGKTLWRVTSASTAALPRAAFALNDAGFVHNNANADIQTD
ncbi:hypothetical protein H3H36_20745 [Duganella sp. FT3S]|uniref:DUF4412 domain-containing protein n=1 Tax=Rugamonas fusca TaxID=2758568 RepID=A0A7W2I8N0_9BURK|nr:hypothetical protein [Rugamonas fusca]MBA5607787.1 hypothetical protein [Rugamonas fusca]